MSCIISNLFGYEVDICSSYTIETGISGYFVLVLIITNVFTIIWIVLIHPTKIWHIIRNSISAVYY